MSTTPAKFDFAKLTIGEAAKCEDLSGQRIAALQDTSEASTLMLAAFAFVWKKRTEPGTTWNEILGTEYGDLLQILGIESEEEIVFDGDTITDTEADTEDDEAGPFPQSAASES